MISRTLSFITLLLAALTLVPGMAHLLEMPHKMQLSQESYGATQYIYRGWALLGLLQFGAIICSFLLYRAARDRRAARLALIAWVCLLLTLVIFFSFTYPVNKATENWSVLPVNWEELRMKWEYSHGASALLELLAYILLLSAVLRSNRRPAL